MNCINLLFLSPTYELEMRTRFEKRPQIARSFKRWDFVFFLNFFVFSTNGAMFFLKSDWYLDGLELSTCSTVQLKISNNFKWYQPHGKTG